MDYSVKPELVQDGPRDAESIIEADVEGRPAVAHRAFQSHFDPFLTTVSRDNACVIPTSS